MTVLDDMSTGDRSRLNRNAELISRSAAELTAVTAATESLDIPHGCLDARATLGGGRRRDTMLPT